MFDTNSYYSQGRCSHDLIIIYNWSTNTINSIFIYCISSLLNLYSSKIVQSSPLLNSNSHWSDVELNFEQPLKFLSPSLRLDWDLAVRVKPPVIGGSELQPRHLSLNWNELTMTWTWTVSLPLSTRLKKYAMSPN